MTIFDVTTYGAIGNGTTDDTKAIQSALDACTTHGGGIVLFPNGTYLVSNASRQDAGCLYPGSSTRLIGESKQGTVLKLAAGQLAFTRPIVFYQVSNVAVSNLTIDGNKANQQTQEEHRAGIFIDTTAHTHLSDLIIQNCTGDAVDYFDDSTDLVMERCLCQDNGRKAVSINGGGQIRSTFRDCQFINNYGSLHVEVQLPVTGVLIDNCLCDRNADGKGYVLSFGGAGPGLVNHTTHVTVRDCVINGAMQAAYYASEVRIVGCRIEPLADLDTTPVVINSECSDVLIEGCSIILPANGAGVNAAIMVQGGLIDGGSRQPDDIRIVNCVISSAAPVSSGVQLINVKSATVSDCSFHNSVGGHAGGAALNVTVTVPTTPTDTIMFHGNTVIDWEWAIAADGCAPIAALIIQNNAITSTGINDLATTPWDLNSSNLGGVRSCTMSGNACRGYTGSLFASVPVCPITSGA